MHVEGSAAAPIGLSRFDRALGAIERFLAGPRFAIWVISLLVAYELALVAVLAIPAGDEGLSRFAEEFKTWCFGKDPATGQAQPMYLAMMLGEPAGLSAIIGGLWWGALRGAGWRAFRIPAAAALCAVLLGGAGFWALHDPMRAGEALPFPAERLRTGFQPPHFELVDHLGKRVSLEALRGKVVLITAIYASCSQTCPAIMAQTKKAVGALTDGERQNLAVLAISLDPAQDTVEHLARLARGQGVFAPLYRLVTGAPAEVERTLDAFGVSRTRDPKTGVITHVNLFLVIDPRGKLAYRFTLGARQEHWLSQALQLLAREAGPAG